MATASGIRTNLNHLNYLIRGNRKSEINDEVLYKARTALEQLNRDYKNLSLDQKVELHGLITLIQQSNIGTDLLEGCSRSILTNIVQDVALRAFRKQVSPRIAAAVNTLIQNGINGYRLQSLMQKVSKDDRDFERITQILLALPQNRQEQAIQYLSERTFKHVTQVDDYLLDLLDKTDGCDLSPYVSNVLIRIEENLATSRKSFGFLFRTKSNPNKEQEQDIILFLNLFKKIGQYIQDRELLKRIADTATRITTAYKTENKELEKVCSDLACFIASSPTIREIGQASARAEEENEQLPIPEKSQLLDRLIDLSFLDQMEADQQTSYRRRAEELKTLIRGMDDNVAEHIIALLKSKSLDVRRMTVTEKADIINYCLLVLKTIGSERDLDKITILKFMRVLESSILIKNEKDIERITRELLAFPQNKRETIIQNLKSRQFTHVTQIDDYLLTDLAEIDDYDLTPHFSEILSRIEETLDTSQVSSEPPFRKSVISEKQAENLILFLKIFEKNNLFIKAENLRQQIINIAEKITENYEIDSERLIKVCFNLKKKFAPTTLVHQEEVGQASARAEEEIDVQSPDVLSILRQIEENLPTSSLFSFTKPNIIEAQAQKIIPLLRFLVKNRYRIENSNLLKEIVNTADRIIRGYKIDNDELKTCLSSLNKVMKRPLVAKEQETKYEILARLIDPNFNGPIDDKQQAEYKQHLEELKDLIEDMDFRFAKDLLTFLKIEGIDTRTRLDKDYKVSLVDYFRVFLIKIKLRDDSEKIHILKVMTNLKIDPDKNIDIHTAPLAVIYRYTDLLIGFPFEKIGSALEKIRSLETRYQIIGVIHPLNMLILSVYKFIEEGSQIDSVIQRSLDATKKFIEKNPKQKQTDEEGDYFVRSVIAFLCLEETLSYELQDESFKSLHQILFRPIDGYIYPNFIRAFTIITFIRGFFSVFPPNGQIVSQVVSLFNYEPLPSLHEVKEANTALLACIPQRNEIESLIQIFENDQDEALGHLYTGLKKLIDSLKSKNSLSEITEYLKNNRESIKRSLLVL